MRRLGNGESMSVRAVGDAGGLDVVERRIPDAARLEVVGRLAATIDDLSDQLWTVVAQLRQSGTPAEALADALGISVPTLYRRIHPYLTDED